MRHRVWKLALAYGGLAFAVGFIFGALRELVLIPALGEAGGHWAEFPLVTAAVCFVGYGLGRGANDRAGTYLTGLGGVAVLLAIEAVFALGVLGQSVDVFLASLDIRRGALFPVGLAAMALAPRLGWRRA